MNDWNTYDDSGTWKGTPTYFDALDRQHEVDRLFERYSEARGIYEER